MNIKKEDLKKDDFIVEMDELIEQECPSCGFLSEGTEYDECPECGEYLIDTFEHQGLHCMLCHSYIDALDDIYVHLKKEVIICDNCYDEIEG